MLRFRGIIYLFLAKPFSERRGSLTHNRREKKNSRILVVHLERKAHVGFFILGSGIKFLGFLAPNQVLVEITR